jgi:hypothetical protein
VKAEIEPVASVLMMAGMMRCLRDFPIVQTSQPLRQWFE